MIKGYSGANEIIYMAKVFGNASTKHIVRQRDTDRGKAHMSIELKMNLSVHSPIRN